MTQTVRKICIVCGADVAQQKRTKDQHGRYYCHSCWHRVTATHNTSESSTSAVRTNAPASPDDPLPLDDLAALDAPLLLDDTPGPIAPPRILTPPALPAPRQGGRKPMANFWPSGVGVRVAVVIVVVIGGIILAGPTLHRLRLKAESIQASHGQTPYTLFPSLNAPERAQPALSDKRLVIAMQTQERLNADYFTDLALNCRIRLPKGFVVAYDYPPGGSRSFRATYGGMPGPALGIGRVNEGGSDLDTYVLAVRSKLLSQFPGMDMAIEDEARTTIAGREGYAITFTGKTKGQPIRVRQVYIPGADQTVFILNYASYVSDWDNSIPLLESSISTFQPLQ